MNEARPRLRQPYGREVPVSGRTMRRFTQILLAFVETTARLIATQRWAESILRVLFVAQPHFSAARPMEADRDGPSIDERWHWGIVAYSYLLVTLRRLVGWRAWRALSWGLLCARTIAGFSACE